MQFYERLPQFSAIQFDGTTESVDKMRRRLLIKLIKTTIETDISGTVLRLKTNNAEHTIQNGDWLVRDPAGTSSVMTSDDFNERFAPVEP
jgi:hypothetical protein